MKFYENNLWSTYQIKQNMKENNGNYNVFYGQLVAILTKTKLREFKLKLKDYSCKQEFYNDYKKMPPWLGVGKLWNIVDRCYDLYIQFHPNENYVNVNSSQQNINEKDKLYYFFDVSHPNEYNCKNTFDFDKIIDYYLMKKVMKDDLDFNKLTRLALIKQMIGGKNG